MRKYFGARFASLFCIVFAIAACAATRDRPDYASILSHGERPAAERDLDATRKPAEVLSFYGVKRGDKVADIYAARGYYTAILSQAVGPEGVVYSVNPTTRQE